MFGQGNLTQAIQHIPVFDGSSRMLESFASILRSLRRAYGKTSDKWILAYLPNKLKGTAHKAFAGNAIQYGTVEALITAMEAIFSGSQDVDALRMELLQVYQKPDESATDFGHRVLDIEHRLLTATASANVNLTEADRKIQEK